MLEVQDLRRSFGGVAAVDGVSFAVAEGTITALIGPTAPAKQPFSILSPAFSARTTGASASPDAASTDCEATQWRVPAWCVPSRRRAC